jgi:orotate phosphoribosyltransferase
MSEPGDPQPDLHDLARTVNSRCRLSGQFTLRSGLTATEYFDKYLFESDPALLRDVVEVMAALMPDRVDLLGGLELGGVPLATLLSQLTAIPTLFIRKQPKPYGTGRLAEGGECAGRTVLLIEDVITTGGAVLNAARALRSMHATVDTVLCAIDRQEPAASQLEAENIQVRSVLTRDMLDAIDAVDATH